MSDDLHKSILDAIGFMAAAIIIPLGWLIFDFETALEIFLVFYFAVAEIVFIIALITKTGNNKENWFSVIFIPLLLIACIFFLF